MNSNVFNKQFPSAFGSAITARFTGITKMMLGVFCMTTQLIQKSTERVKNIVPLTVVCLVILSLLAISNVFVTERASAHYISFKWNYRTNSDAICPRTNGQHTPEREACHHEDILTITGTEASYPARVGTLRRPSDHSRAWEAQLRWRIDGGAWKSTAITRAPAMDDDTIQLNSPYGHWVLNDDGSGDASGNQHWTPNTNGIKSILPGSTVEIELLSWQDGHNRQAAGVHNKLTIQPNTFATWNTASRNTSFPRDIAEQRMSSSIGNEKLATISTHESDFTNFSYKSKQYVGTNPVVERDLAVDDVDNTWMNESTFNTPYGRWIVGTTTGTPRNCGSLKCQDVKFVPNTSALNGLTDSLKLELEIILTKNGMVEETDTITYLLNIPTFSISASNESYNEDDENAQFTVTSNINPGTGLYSVMYTPRDVSGDFLGTGDGASGDSRTESIRFMAGQDQDGNAEYTATIDVALRDKNSVDEANGTIKVELDRVTSSTNNINFTIVNAPAAGSPANTPSNAAQVTIKDANTPIISIDNAPTIVASQMAQFPLTADIQPHQELMIRYIPTEIGSNFLDPAGGISTEDFMKPVRFTEQPDNSGKGTLSIPTRIDDTVSIGTLKVQLIADMNTTDKTYDIAGTDLSRTKVVSIIAYPIRTISIEESTIDVREGQIAKVTLTADDDPQRSDLPISYTLSTRGHNYIKDVGMGNTRTAELDFQENIITGKWEAEITIETKDNNNDYNGDGEIDVVLDDPGASFYRIASAMNDRNKVTLKVDDLTKPLIKIRDGNAVTGYHTSGSRAGNLLHARFPMTSNFGGSVPLKYRRTETANFFDPAITDENEVKTVSIQFSGGGTTKNGHFDHNLDDRDDSAEGTVTVTLLEDPDNNYVLSDNLAERSGSVRVKDPSYSEFNHFNVNGTNTPHGPVNGRIGFLYIKDNPVNYLANTTARVLDREKNKFKIYSEWFLDDSQSTSDTGSGRTSNSNIIQGDTNVANRQQNVKYGIFQLDGTGWGGGDPHRTRGARFILDRAKLNEIPLGSRARIVTYMEVPTKKFNVTTLHLVPNTQAYWNSNSNTKTNTITQQSNTYEVGTRKEGTIITHNDPVTDLVFKSKVYDNSTTAVEETLMDEEVESDWTGMEKTHNTAYGKWIVGNLHDCGTVPQHMTQSKCYDVRFEPNLTAINQINGKIVKLDLETSITDEVDTISLIITSEGSISALIRITQILSKHPVVHPL